MSRLRTAAIAAASAKAVRDGLRFSYALPAAPTAPEATAPADADNPLEEYFDSIDEGPGQWKWRHYFSIYHRHLAKFAGRNVHLVEIGVYGGGSLPMWRHYLGNGCHVYGVDIEPACKAHEQEGIRVFIGDQADPAFWARFLEDVPRVDVVVDDGGHTADQQIGSIRALLPWMAFGGVYICEDIHTAFHQTHSFIDGATRPLHDVHGRDEAPALPVHQHIASVHHYPALTVIEKPDRPVATFDNPRRGSEWLPGIYDD